MRLFAQHLAEEAGADLSTDLLRLQFFDIKVRILREDCQVILKNILVLAMVKIGVIISFILWLYNFHLLAYIFAVCKFLVKPEIPLIQLDFVANFDLIEVMDL